MAPVNVHLGLDQCVTAGMSVSGVTILLSLTVFLNLVAETLPQVSDAIPLLGRASSKYQPASQCLSIYLHTINITYLLLLLMFSHLSVHLHHYLKFEPQILG